MSKLFNGTLYFVQVAFSVPTSKSTSLISTEDMRTAIAYASKAVVPIALYAAQYGKSSVRVHPEIITYNAEFANKSIDDGDIRQIVNDVASRLPSDACVVILLPPDIDNSTYSRGSGTGGYHDSADVPYINSYVSNDLEGTRLLTVPDVTWRYAGALSHEIAEMVADPTGDGPEVCDPCGPNYVSTYLAYFDVDGNYITTTQTPPYDPDLGFVFGFYLNAIVKPAFAKPMAAPAAACCYAPVSVSATVVETIADPLCCGAFWSSDDEFRHVIVGSKTGDISEVFYHPKKGKGVSRLATVPGLVDLDAFFTPDDDFRHVISASAEGVITERFYHPRKGQGEVALATIPNAERVAGFYSDDDGYRHAIVSTASGQVFEVFFHPRHGSGKMILGAFDSILDIGAFYSRDDKRRHVIVATASGIVTEMYYGAGSGVSHAQLASVPNVARLAAYYIDAAKDIYDRRVQIASSKGEAFELRYNPRAPTVNVRLATPGSLRDIAGFHTPDDDERHAICQLAQGDLEELYFSP